jgi:hypothetical protein
MMTLNIHLDKNLSEFIKRVKEGMPQVLDKAVADTSSWGKSQIMRSTVGKGQTRGGWYTNKKESMVHVIWNKFKHMMYLETGTGLYGPRHRRIIASEVTKTGGPFSWISFTKNTAGGRVFISAHDGMEAQPAIKPNVEKIQKDLNKRIKLAIRNIWNVSKERK